MVRGASHERYARDGGTGDACGGGGCLRGARGDRAPGYQEFIGVLCFVEEVADRGKNAAEPSCSLFFFLA